MTSLLQHQGRVTEEGVGLIFELEDGERFTCSQCGKEHPVLYEAFRKPAGRFGHFVVFRYLGKENIPDLSVPITVPEVPRGGKKLSQERAEEYWHSN